MTQMKPKAAMPYSVLKPTPITRSRNKKIGFRNCGMIRKIPRAATASPIEK